MYLTSKIHIKPTDKHFELIDFLSYKSKQLKNQVLYTIRQPWLYYDNIKNNKPVFPQQLKLIEELNSSIKQYNKDLISKQIKETNKEAENISNRFEYISFIDEQFTEPKVKSLLKSINESNYWVDNKDLLQYHCKNLDSFQVLQSQCAQQVIHQTINEFKSYRELLKKYFNDKLLNKANNYVPRIPYYLDKLDDRNIINFSNQQLKQVKDYLIINWKSSEISQLYKDKQFNYVDEIELDAKQLDKLTYKSNNKLNTKANKKLVNTNNSIKYKLKNNSFIKQEIINKEVVNDNNEIDYKINLKTTYSKFPDKIRFKLPTNVNLKDIKQLRIIPATQANPIGYTVEIVYELKEYSLDTILANNPDKLLFKELVKQQNNDLLVKVNTKIDKKLTKKDSFLDINYKLQFNALDKLFKSHKENNNINKDNSLINNLKVCSLDPGMQRLFTLTNNICLQPVVFKDNEIVKFNQWYNKITAKHQEHIKTTWNTHTSKKLKNLNVHRERKIENWLHLISTRIVEYLAVNNFDLLVIGKNIRQKTSINIGKMNNQKFVQLPFTKLWHKIAYKAYQKGILFIEQEESYTSKSSFISNDILPTYNKTKKEDKVKLPKKSKNKDINSVEPKIELINKTNVEEITNNQVIDNLIEEIKYKFSGVRNKGIYKEKNKLDDKTMKIHSDVHGSYNIGRKLFLRLGVDFSFNTLINKLNNKNNNIKDNSFNKTISRKLLHKLFQPIMINLKNINDWNTKALKELETKNLKTNSARVARLEHIQITSNLVVCMKLHDNPQSQIN